MGRMSIINAMPLTDAVEAMGAYLHNPEFIAYGNALDERLRQLSEPNATFADVVDAFAAGQSIEDAAAEIEEQNIIRRDEAGEAQP